MDLNFLLLIATLEFSISKIIAFIKFSSSVSDLLVEILKSQYGHFSHTKEGGYKDLMEYQADSMLLNLFIKSDAARPL